MDAQMNWSEWLLDVSLWPNYCFVPYERTEERIILGIMMIQERCPGDLCGVIHSEGQAKCEEWCNENPEWMQKFSEQE